MIFIVKPSILIGLKWIILLIPLFSLWSYAAPLIILLRTRARRVTCWGIIGLSASCFFTIYIFSCRGLKNLFVKAKRMHLYVQAVVFYLWTVGRKPDCLLCVLYLAFQHYSGFLLMLLLLLFTLLCLSRNNKALAWTWFCAENGLKDLRWAFHLILIPLRWKRRLCFHICWAKPSHASALPN